jgi:hypothetical protein
MPRGISPGPETNLTLKGLFDLIETLSGFIEKAAWAVVKVVIALALVNTIVTTEFPKPAPQTSQSARQLDAVIQDPEGNPIAGQAVTLVDLATGQQRILKAGQDGKISAPLRGDGRYEVRFEQPDAVFRFQIAANQSATWILTLQPAHSGPPSGIQTTTR